MSSTPSTHHSRTKRQKQSIIDVTCVALAVVIWTAVAANAQDKRKGERSDKVQRKGVPQNQDMEGSAGLKIRGVELVADGGLVLVRYTVLNPDLVEKVKNKEATADGPQVANTKTNKSLEPSGGMKHNHKLRAGQTDFTLYQNTDAAVRRGDRVDITVEGIVLKDVPVE